MDQAPLEWVLAQVEVLEYVPASTAHNWAVAMEPDTAEAAKVDLDSEVVVDRK